MTRITPSAPVRSRGGRIRGMRISRKFVTAVRPPSGPQIEISQRLQLRAGRQVVAGVVIRFVALPDPDSLQPDARGFVVVRHCDVDAAAIAIDAAAEADFIGIDFRRDLVAIAVGVEIAWPMAIFEAEAKMNNW